MQVLLATFWNPEEQRPRSFWRMLAGLALMFIISTALIIGTLVLLRAGFKTEVLPQLSSELKKYIQMIVGVIAGSIAVTVVCFFAARFLDRRGMVGYGFGSAFAWRDGIAGFLLGILLMLLIFLVELGLDWTVWQVNPIELSDQIIIQVVGLLLFMLVGYYEELLARGFLLLNMAEGLGVSEDKSKRFIRLLGTVGAFLLSSVIFAIIHSGNPNMNLFSYTGLFLAGVFLGLPYVLTGELWFSIGLHWSWNFAQGFIFGFPVSGIALPGSWIINQSSGPVLWTGGRFGPEAGLLGFLAIATGCLLIFLYVYMTRGSIAIRLPLFNRAHTNAAERGNSEDLPDATGFGPR